MKSVECLRVFLQLPELSAVGSSQERAAFIGVRLNRRTVRETGEAIGVSKSQVTNLADMFQAKLARRVSELRDKRIAVSQEYRSLVLALHRQLGELAEESGSDDNDSGGDWKLSREDYAEVTGTPLRNPDEWN